MGKKYKPPDSPQEEQITGMSQRVQCPRCIHSADVIDNSCFCKMRGRRVCACLRYGRICALYEPRSRTDASRSMPNK
jgi:hypothetical protein